MSKARCCCPHRLASAPPALAIVNPMTVRTAAITPEMIPNLPIFSIFPSARTGPVANPQIAASARIVASQRQVACYRSASDAGRDVGGELGGLRDACAPEQGLVVLRVQRPLRGLVGIIDDDGAVICRRGRPPANENARTVAASAVSRPAANRNGHQTPCCRAQRIEALNSAQARSEAQSRRRQPAVVVRPGLRPLRPGARNSQPDDRENRSDHARNDPQPADLEHMPLRPDAHTSQVRHVLWRAKGGLHATVRLRVSDPGAKSNHEAV
jgi:hypothetical protein